MLVLDTMIGSMAGTIGACQPLPKLTVNNFTPLGSSSLESEFLGNTSACARSLELNLIADGIERWS